jgi:hypothetical protein
LARRRQVELQAGARTFFFRCDDEDACMLWVNAIMRALTILQARPAAFCDSLYIILLLDVILGIDFLGLDFLLARSSAPSN